MTSLNEKIQDLLITRSILTEQLKSKLANDTKREYLKILDDIIARLKTNDEINIKNVNKIIKELKELVTPKLDLQEDFNQIAISEAAFVQTAFNGAVGFEMIKKIPNESVLLKIARSEAIEGYALDEYMSQFDNKIRFDLQGQLKQAVIQGETIPQAVSRVKSLFGTKFNNIDTIVRTGIATINSNARRATYEENEDIFKGWTWSATLDSLTRISHLVLDGAFWSLDGKGLNQKGKENKFRNAPDGWNCRCLLIPVTKSYKEMGIDIEEIPKGTRSSIDGYVPQDLNFTDWLKRKDDVFVEKVLGKKRADLYLSGKITLSDLVTKNGRVLGLKELENLSNN